MLRTLQKKEALETIAVIFNPPIGVLLEIRITNI